MMTTLKVEARRSLERCVSLRRTRRSVSELKPTDALLLLAQQQLLMFRRSRGRTGVEGDSARPGPARPGRSTTIGHGSPRSAAAPRPPATAPSGRSAAAQLAAKLRRKRLLLAAAGPFSLCTRQRWRSHRPKFDFPVAYSRTRRGHTFVLLRHND